MNAIERIKEVFSQALEKTAGPERDAFLTEVCQGDSELRGQVQSLLFADDQAGAFLGKTMLVPPYDFMIEPSGAVIGRYKLLQPIGEGGFGVVYMAEQIEPVQRKVAIKVIKAGMDTREVVARFEAERQALALMEHPNIARVLDAGATEAGRPYFVMELVNGIPIMDYCDREQLTTTQRLQLFVKVCHAVQHAHQKGIIHRDLKPSNARELQAYVKKNPLDADYVLYADYQFNRHHWQQGGVQFVLCDRQGEWVIAELTNSDHEDYQRVKPVSVEGCDKLLVERLAERLR
jgi:hypothetical protein